MTLVYWHWLLLGFSLIATEVLIPGAFFLWIGITAFFLGALSFLFPTLPMTPQLVLFGILAPLITFVGRKIVRPPSQEAPSLLNRRGQQLIGEVIVLDVPIIHGHAHVTVGDSKWRVKGPDLPAGVEVQIKGVEGNTLIVTMINDL